MSFTQRQLPHIYEIGNPMFVTFRLYGSLPPGRHFPGGRRSAGVEFLELDRLLDREGGGPLYLRTLEIAGVVAHAISQGAEREYALHAWVVMPNHVHLLMTPNVSLPGIMKRLKGTTAREANRRLGREGTPFWQHESYDRLVRDAREFGNIERYILQNPVRAGLAVAPEKFRWSSAWIPEAGRD